jgi:hypothetical protein
VNLVKAKPTSGSENLTVKDTGPSGIGGQVPLRISRLDVESA